MEENKLTEAEKYLLKNRTPKQKLTKEDVLKGTSTLTMASLREFVHQNPDIDGDAPVLVERVLDYYFEHGGWGLFFELLEYKTNVVKVNPAYTSQKCSKCGHTCKENRKTQSLFECVSCGFTMNADEQACMNIFQRGQSLMEANVGR